DAQGTHGMTAESDGHDEPPGAAGPGGPRTPARPVDDGIFPAGILRGHVPRVDTRESWGKSEGTGQERVFLEGPHKRRAELLRTIRIGAEFIRAFRTLHFLGPCVTVFGSARFGE